MVTKQVPHTAAAVLCIMCAVHVAACPLPAPIFQGIFSLSAPAQQPRGPVSWAPTRPRPETSGFLSSLGSPVGWKEGGGVWGAAPLFSFKLLLGEAAGSAAEPGCQGRSCGPGGTQSPGPPLRLPAQRLSGLPHSKLRVRCRLTKWVRPFGTPGKWDSHSGPALRTGASFPSSCFPTQVPAAPPLRHLAPSS